MSMSKLSYPIYKVARSIEAFEQILGKAIADTNPLYFETNSRFRGLGKVSSTTLVDYMGIYEEGDWWALTVINVIDSKGLLKYIFLPLTGSYTSSVEVDNKALPFSLGDTVFEFETHSEDKGTLNVRIFDAFTDIGFYIKIINLFLPWKDIPHDHVNAYTAIHERGVGKFTFNSPQNFQLKWDHDKGVHFELTETGDLLVKYGDSYRLIFYKNLPFLSSVANFRSSPNLLGWIAYSGAETPELLIAVLEAVSDNTT